jgi:hypothetical protein
MSGPAQGSGSGGEGTPKREPELEPERVSLFTVSALRLHLPRGGMPPTPGTEPSLVQRLSRRIRQAGALLEVVRERLRGG